MTGHWDTEKGSTKGSSTKGDTKDKRKTKTQRPHPTPSPKTDPLRRGPAPTVTTNNHSRLFRPPPKPVKDLTNREDRTCYNCGKKGHIAKDCTEPRRPRAMKQSWKSHIQGAVANLLDLTKSEVEVDPALAVSEVLEGMVSQIWDEQSLQHHDDVPDAGRETEEKDSEGGAATVAAGSAEPGDHHAPQPEPEDPQSRTDSASSDSEEDPEYSPYRLTGNASRLMVGVEHERTGMMGTAECVDHS